MTTTTTTSGDFTSEKFTSVLQKLKTVIIILKPKKLLGVLGVKDLSPCCVLPLRSWRDLSTLASNNYRPTATNRADWVLTQNIDRRSSHFSNSQKIEDNYSAKKKADAVFINFTAAYNTEWHCSFSPANFLSCQLLSPASFLSSAG